MPAPFRLNDSVFLLVLTSVSASLLLIAAHGVATPLGAVGLVVALTAAFFAGDVVRTLLLRVRSESTRHRHRQV